MEITRAAELLSFQPSKQNSRAELQEKTREFEAVLIEKMLSSMQPKNSLFGSGFQGDFYQSLFIQEIAKKIAEKPGLGLGDNIYRTLQGQQEVRRLSPGEDGFRL